MMTSAKSGLSDLLAPGRAETDQVFAFVKDDALYERPIPERHRIVFYIGHLEAFDWNLLADFLGLAPFDAELDRLFAFGIDPVDGGLPRDVPSDWPALAEVEAYKEQVRWRLDAALEETAESTELKQRLEIAAEHRLMHAETLEYMLHQLPHENKIAISEPIAVTAPSAHPSMVQVPAGSALLGLDRETGEFGWDNEFDAHRVTVPAFSIDKFKVTNGEYLRFVESGGYREQSLWTDADWEWKTQAGVRHPVFWVPTSRGMLYRSMFEDAPLVLDAPVFVSHAEASAYAKWAGKQLPTEAEWQRAADGSGQPETSREWMDAPPVSWPIAAGSMFGVEGLIGTGWEWTNTPFAPFAGFEQFAEYPGYSANFFDNKHYVLKGGSTRTAGRMLRKSFRNWFQPHYQYVYAGFRCVKH